MKQFVLSKNILGQHCEVPISEESFTEAKKAFNILNEVVFLEERFDAVACCALDFEKAMMEKLLDNTYAGFGDGLNQMAVRRYLNRVLMNALSSARGFIDHFPHACNCVFGKDDPLSDECFGLLKKSYDELVGYRIFEALRNHSQHFGFPIQSISFLTEIKGAPPDSQARLSISPITETQVLEQNKKFKKTVLEEMKSIGSKIDLKPYFREYITGIAKAHYRFRKLSAPIVEKAGNILNYLSEKYMSAKKDETQIGLYAVVTEDEQWIESIPLFSGMKDYGSYLSGYNLFFDCTGNFFIASVDRGT